MREPIFVGGPFHGQHRAIQGDTLPLILEVYIGPDRAVHHGPETPIDLEEIFIPKVGTYQLVRSADKAAGYLWQGVRP